MSRVRPPVPPKLLKQLLERADFRCQNPACGAQATDAWRLVPDHIVAVVRGGATTLENMQILCEFCNRRKGVGGNEALPDKEACANRTPNQGGRPKRQYGGVVVPMPVSLSIAPPPPPPTREAVYEERAEMVSEDGYTPTPKQDRFRRTAQRCLATGKFPTPPDWCLQHEADHAEIVRLDEFERWMKEEEFERWFYAPMRWVPDAAHKRMMEGHVVSAIHRGVMSGDARAIEAAMSLLGMNKRPAADAPASVQDDLREFKKKGANGKVERSKSASGLAMNDE